MSTINIHYAGSIHEYEVSGPDGMNEVLRRYGADPAQARVYTNGGYAYERPMIRVPIPGARRFGSLVVSAVIDGVDHANSGPLLSIVPGHIRPFPFN